MCMYVLKNKFKSSFLFFTVHTFGLVPPAKPALIVAVPQSMTMGWLSMAAAAPEEVVGTLSPSLLMVMDASYTTSARVIERFGFVFGSDLVLSSKCVFSSFETSSISLPSSSTHHDRAASSSFAQVVNTIYLSSTDEDDLFPLLSSQVYIDRLLPCGLLSWPSIANSRLHQHKCCAEDFIAVPESYNVIGEWRMYPSFTSRR